MCVWLMVDMSPSFIPLMPISFFSGMLLLLFPPHLHVLHSRHLIRRHAARIHPFHVSHPAHAHIRHGAMGVWIHGRDLRCHARARSYLASLGTTTAFRLRENGVYLLSC